MRLLYVKKREGRIRIVGDVHQPLQVVMEDLCALEREEPLYIELPCQGSAHQPFGKIVEKGRLQTTACDV